MAVFFVTSSDSGALVIDMITSGGETTPPLWQRVFWAILAGVVASVLLVAGGLTALQTAAIASALPFTVVMLLMCFGLRRALRVGEGALPGLEQRPAAVSLPVMGEQPPWGRRLANLLAFREDREVVAFIRDTVQPALTEVAAELRRRGLDARVTATEDGAELATWEDGRRDFLYRVRARGYRMPAFAFPEFTFKPDEEARYYVAEVYLKVGPQQQDLAALSGEEVIHDLLSRYERHIRLTKPLTGSERSR